MRGGRFYIAGLALLLSLMPHSAGWAQTETYIVQGSTTFTHEVMEPYQKDIERLSGHKLTVVPNKSSLGILALFEKRGDFAMTSGPLENEIKGLKRSHPDLPFHKLRTFNIGQTRMAFAVNRANPVHAISADKMRDILLGKITNWRDVGGPDLPIKIVQVSEGGGAAGAIESELLDGKPISASDRIRGQISSLVVKIGGKLPQTLGCAHVS